jgi:hypothetical protein
MKSPQAQAFEALQRDARRLVADNARRLNGFLDAPLQERARRWWDLPAKQGLAGQIAKQEKARALAMAAAAGDDDPHNDRFDAERHARWSNRMATEIGPIFAQVAGSGHEVTNELLDGQPGAESYMDLHNNAEGRRAARDRRPIDPGRLQVSPNVRRPPITAGYSRR